MLGAGQQSIPIAQPHILQQLVVPIGVQSVMRLDWSCLTEQE